MVWMYVSLVDWRECWGWKGCVRWAAHTCWNPGKYQQNQLYVPRPCLPPALCVLLRLMMWSEFSVFVLFLSDQSLEFSRTGTVGWWWGQAVWHTAYPCVRPEVSAGSEQGMVPQTAAGRSRAEGTGNRFCYSVGGKRGLPLTFWYTFVPGFIFVPWKFLLWNAYA